MSSVHSSAVRRAEEEERLAKEIEAAAAETARLEEIKRDRQVSASKLEDYVEQSGIAIAFKIIFLEIV